MASCDRPAAVGSSGCRTRRDGVVRQDPATICGAARDTESTVAGQRGNAKSTIAGDGEPARDNVLAELWATAMASTAHHAMMD